MDRTSSERVGQITKELVAELLAPRSSLCATLMMPLERASAKARANRTNLRNLLRQAHTRLVQEGMERDAAHLLLRPGLELADDVGPWHENRSGLALFASPGYFQKLLVPIPLPTIATVSHRFYIAPLFPLFGSEREYAVLALSVHSHRLVRANRFSTLEVLLEGPEGETKQPSRREKQLQFRSAPSTSGGVVFHGHGAGEEIRKDEIVKTLRDVAKKVEETLKKDERIPLVVACVEHLFHLYRDVNTYPYLLETCAAGNPDEWSEEELRTRAWHVVEPLLQTERRKAAKRLEEALRRGTAADNVGECLLAAHEGRLEVLFVPVGVEMWGRFDAEAAKVEVRAEQAPGDEDLLNLAASLAFSHGATVYAVPPEEIPLHCPMAGLLRY